MLIPSNIKLPQLLDAVVGQEVSFRWGAAKAFLFPVFLPFGILNFQRWQEILANAAKKLRLSAEDGVTR